jgi:DNA-binding MarR family transcriptional regulator
MNRRLDLPSSPDAHPEEVNAATATGTATTTAGAAAPDEDSGARAGRAGDVAAASSAMHDPESRLADEHHDSLRLWLRLFTCTLLIEKRIRTQLRERFATTLPRFDLMAQLERHPDGLRMGELSQRLMVTGGNVTGLVDQLVAEGLVTRTPTARDRRALVVKLTARGKEAFDAMADEHERWIEAMFGGLAPSERMRLQELLGGLKRSLTGPTTQPTTAPTTEPTTEPTTGSTMGSTTGSTTKLA